MFKIIKIVKWTTKEGKEGITYVVAYKGRALTLVAEDFANLKISADKKTLDPGEKVEVLIETYENEEGEHKKGLRIKPIFDLDVAKAGI